MSLAVGLMSVLLCGGPFWSPIIDDEELMLAIRDIDMLRNGSKTDFALLETRLGDLLTKFAEPNRRGVLLFHAVNVYAVSGMQHRRMIITHSKEALSLLRDPARRAALHVFCGDASRLGLDSEVEEQRRKLAVNWYLEGLAEIEALGLDFSLMNRPRVLPDRLPPEAIGALPDATRELMSKLLEKRRKEVQLQQQLADEQRLAILMDRHQKVLIGQIVSLYKSHPEDRQQLAMMIRSTVKSPTTFELIMQQIPEEGATSTANTVVSLNGERRIWLIVGNVAFAVIILCIWTSIRMRKRGNKKTNR